jgi:predicted transcriptional regulator of viral defense system
MRPKSARRQGLEGAIGGIAERQHGLVTLAQLSGLGLDGSTVRKRVATGRLHRVHSGVYSVGVPVYTRKAELMAAVLACGPGAVLSHRSAAELWGICEIEPGSVDVTAPNRRGRAPDGIASHRNGSVMVGDRTVLDDIPCTTIPRLLLDFAAVATLDELRSAVNQAEIRKLVRRSLVREQIRRHRGRRGVARLRLVFDQIHPETKRTRSELEIEFLTMCRVASLPQPEVNVKLEVEDGRLEVDFLWRDARLIMEADSRRFHGTDSAFLTDRQREQKLQLAGWRVSHCTWEQVEFEPRTLARTVHGLLTL